MKLIVSIKRVIDYHVKIRVKADGSGVETANIKMGINPFDEIALEEAIRLKEQGMATEIIVVTCGPSVNQDVLRTALAMGADRAILLKTEVELQPLAVAKLLQALIAQEKPQLVILGKQAIDDDANQTGQMLAGLLNWPQATFASKLVIKNHVAIVDREVDMGIETLEVNLPAVITTDLRLNQPRYISMPNIMKAKQKPLMEIEAASLGVDLNSHLQIVEVNSPPDRKAGVKVNSVTELISHLKQAQVL